MGYVSLESIGAICKNKGGIASMIFFEDNGNVIIPDAMNGASVSSSINFIGAPALFTIVFRKYTAKIREVKNTNNRAGDFYTKEILMFVPQNRLAVLNLNDRLKNRRINCVTRDQNGFRRMFLGLRHASEFDSGDRFSTRNGDVYRFTAESELISPYYIPDVIDVPDGVCPDGLQDLDGAQLINLEGNCLIQL
jgi:hypothetical protein